MIRLARNGKCGGQMHYAAERFTTVCFKTRWLRRIVMSISEGVSQVQIHTIGLRGAELTA